VWSQLRLNRHPGLKAQVYVVCDKTKTLESKNLLSMKNLTCVAEDWQMPWYHLSLRCCSALANEKVPSASTPSTPPCWLSHRDSFCHQRVFTDEAWLKAFLTSLSEGNLLSLLIYLSPKICQCSCNGTLPNLHKTMPSRSLHKSEVSSQPS